MSGPKTSVPMLPGGKYLLLSLFACTAYSVLPRLQQVIAENQKYLDFLHCFSLEHAFRFNPEKLGQSDANSTKTSDLLYVIPVTAIILLVRLIFENFVVTPISRKFNLSNRKPIVQPNAALEPHYKRGKKIKENEISKLSLEYSLPRRDVERWFRKRRSTDKATVHQRFLESTWRGTFYFTAFCYGLFILWDKPWTWNLKLCFPVPLPMDVGTDIRMYYIVELAFYSSLMISQFTDVRRSDFWEMFIHHILTLLLICISWYMHMTRIGSLVMVVHDCSDWLLELTKSTIYLKLPRIITDIGFIIFTAVFMFSRLYVYPHLPYYSYVYVMENYGSNEFQSFFGILVFMLWLLVVLHIFWSYLLCKAILNVTIRKKNVEDNRSDSEISDDDDDVNKNN